MKVEVRVNVFIINNMLLKKFVDYSFNKYVLQQVEFLKVCKILLLKMLYEEMKMKIEEIKQKLKEQYEEKVVVRSCFMRIVYNY